MKELSENFKENAVQIVEEKQQRKEIKLIGRQRRIPGLILWEFNEKTKELKPVTFKPKSIFISSSLTSTDTTKTYKCVVNDNCLYFQALNESNAMKKLKRTKLL